MRPILCLLSACRVLVLLLLVSAADARQLSDLRSDVRVLIGDSGNISARYRFSDTQVDDFLNECQRDAIAQAMPLVRSSSFELVAGTTYYGLGSSNFIALKRVTWRNRVLTEISPTKLDMTKEWEEVSGAPQNYFMTFASRTVIGIYPFPADSTSTGTVKVEFYAQADALSATTDQPFNGVREFYPVHHALAYCAASRTAAIDGQNDLAAYYLQVYVQTLSRLASLATARPSYLPSFSPTRDASPQGP